METKFPRLLQNLAIWQRGYQHLNFLLKQKMLKKMLMVKRSGQYVSIRLLKAVK